MLLDHCLNIDAIYSETPTKLVQSEEIIQTLEKKKNIIKIVIKNLE